MVEMLRSIVKYYKVLVHAFVWTVFFILHVNYFANILDYTDALVRGTLLLFLFQFVFYTNWFVLLPRYYIRKRFFSYVILCFALLMVATLCRVNVEDHYHVMPSIVRYRLFHANPARIYVVSFVLYLFVLVSSFFLKIADYYTLQNRQKEELVQQKTEAELKLLKAQLNPHFLFNALNNIYALVLTRSDHAADSLMSLSQLLRYIIYEAVSEKVSLEKEIIYLKYYIELESLRIVKKEQLTVEIDVLPEQYTIMPLLFLPFIENSFKHGNINQNGYIRIKLNQRGNKLEFICENSCPKASKVVDPVGGIGLANTRKRLEMLYPGAHQLNINRHENVFTVNLTLQL